MHPSTTSSCRVARVRERQSRIAVTIHEAEGVATPSGPSNRANLAAIAAFNSADLSGSACSRATTGGASRATNVTASSSVGPIFAGNSWARAKRRRIRPRRESTQRVQVQPSWSVRADSGSGGATAPGAARVGELVRAGIDVAQLLHHDRLGVRHVHLTRNLAALTSHESAKLSERARTRQHTFDSGSAARSSADGGFPVGRLRPGASRLGAARHRRSPWIGVINLESLARPQSQRAEQPEDERSNDHGCHRVVDLRIDERSQ